MKYVGSTYIIVDIVGTSRLPRMQQQRIPNGLPANAQVRVSKRSTLEGSQGIAMNSVIDKNTALIINNLLRELASELDLHYEDEDLRVITPTIERMKTAAQLVVNSGFETPDSYRHILSRYQRVFN